MVNLVRRPIMFVVTVLLMFAASLVIPASTAVALGDATPVIETSPDTFTFWAGSQPDVQIKKNDAGLQDGAYPKATLTGLKKEALGDKTVLKIYGAIIYLKIDPTRTDPISFEYKYEDEESGAVSEWTPVTITVKKMIPIKVTQPRRGRLKFTNKNSKLSMCEWGSRRLSVPFGKVKVGVDASRVIRINRETLWVLCYMKGRNGAVTYDRTLRGLKV